MDGVSDRARDWLTWALEDQLRHAVEAVVLPGEPRDPARDDQIFVTPTVDLTVEITLDPEEGSVRPVFYLEVKPDGLGSLSYGPWSMPIGHVREADLAAVSELAVRGSSVLEVMCT